MDIALSWLAARQAGGSTVDRSLGSRLKIKRAEKHIGQLERLVTRFLRGNPYEGIRDKHPETGEPIYRVREHKKPPITWSLIIGDAVHNLRSSLDLLFHQLVLANGRTPTDHMRFPVYKSRMTYESEGRRVIEPVGTDALLVFDTLKPYQGGNDRLWRLHKLDLEDKHRLLIPVAVAFGGLTTRVGSRPDSTAFRIQQRAWRQPVEDGTILPLIVHLPNWPDGGRPGLYVDRQFAFDVTLGDSPVLKGEPIVAALRQFSAFATETLDLFGPFLR